MRGRSGGSGDRVRRCVGCWFAGVEIRERERAFYAGVGGVLDLCWHDCFVFLYPFSFL